MCSVSGKFRIIKALTIIIRTIQAMSWIVFLIINTSVLEGSVEFILQLKEV